MPPVEFEHKISAGQRSQTYALDRAATGTGVLACLFHPKSFSFFFTSAPNYSFQFSCTFSYFNPMPHSCVPFVGRVLHDYHDYHLRDYHNFRCFVTFIRRLDVVSSTTTGLGDGRQSVVRIPARDKLFFTQNPIGWVPAFLSTAKVAGA
jgi:hypothetical protein